MFKFVDKFFVFMDYVSIECSNFTNRKSNKKLTLRYRDFNLISDLDKSFSIERVCLSKVFDEKVELHSIIFGAKTKDVSKYISRLMDSPVSRLGSSYFCLVDGEVVGTCDLLNFGRFLILGNFGLIPSCRGKGFSKLFLSECLVDAFSNHVDMDVKLTLSKSNSKALAVYSAIGFK